MNQENFPRPDFVRPRLNFLNGEWDFVAINKNWEPSNEIEYTAKINVPFLPNTKNSNVSLSEKHPVYLYRKTFQLNKADLSGVILLNFGAAFGITSVYLNNILIGVNQLNYTYFTYNITDAVIEGENTIIVKTMATEKHLEQGKLGLWRDVWLEFAGKSFIEYIHSKTNIEKAEVHIQGKINNVIEKSKLQITIYHEQTQVAKYTYNARKNINVIIKIPPPLKLWSVGKGELYDIKIVLLNSLGGALDSVYTNASFKKIIIKDKMLLINGQPCLLRQVRDKCCYLNSGHTLPSSKEAVTDFTNLMTLGFNGMCIEGIPDPKHLYIADKLGLLITIEMDYSLYNIDNPDQLKVYLQEIDRIVLRDYRHPSIVIWTALPKYFGSEEASKSVYNCIRDNDERPISSAGGGYHYYTDIYDKYVISSNIDEFKKLLFYNTNGPLLSEREERKLYKTNPKLLPPSVLAKMPLYISAFSFLSQEHLTGDITLSETEFVNLYIQSLTLIRQAKPIGYAYSLLTDESNTNSYGLFDARRVCKLSNSAKLKIRAANLEQTEEEKTYQMELEKHKKLIEDTLATSQQQPINMQSHHQVQIPIQNQPQ